MYLGYLQHSRQANGHRTVSKVSFHNSKADQKNVNSNVNRRLIALGTRGLIQLRRDLRDKNVFNSSYLQLKQLRKTSVVSKLLSFGIVTNTSGS